MFGSDQMTWPDAIGLAVETIEKADFLSADQKRDILYNNAARFLRLSPEQIAKIGAYMQFDRDLHEQQGLGLGLTICRRLAQMHGGTLTVQSQPDAGTTVTLTFPKPGAGPAAAPRAAQSGSIP